MREVLIFDNGLRWVLIETEQEASLAPRLLGMRLDVGYAVDQALGYRSNYYFLTNKDVDIGRVVGMIHSKFAPQ